MLRKSTWYWCRWLILLTFSSLVGCGGCRQDEQLTREELEKRAKEQRDALEISNLLALPADSETKILRAKPGHWHQTQQEFKSNREDLQVVVEGSVSRSSEPTLIPGTDMVNEFTRRTSLPKGQTKTVDLGFFVPFSGVPVDPMSGVTSRLSFRTRLLAVPLMTPILQTPSIMPANELKEHEFQLIVLSPEATSYDYLSALDAVFWRGEEFMMEERIRSYYVSLVKPEEDGYSFPNTMLAMTTIAVIVWDDVSPDDLSREQQQALIDWVHWGGQLLVSGPGSWSRLQNSFLAPYLPARSASVAELTTPDFSEISQTWVVDDRARNARREPLEIVGAPLAGLRLQLTEESQWLPGAGQLVAERQVGRGRVVVTGFAMREPQVYRWKYYSSLFSTGLLRRQAREFRRNSAEDTAISQYWTSPFANSERDPRMHSNVRILTRDLPLSTFSKTAGANADQNTANDFGVREDPGAEMQAADFSSERSVDPLTDERLNLPAAQTSVSTEAMRWGGSGAAWNDYSGLSNAALAALKSAAGIELPTRKTIIYLLAGYLACLVPLNWLIFRMLGHLEWAWIAAPVMAIAGVVVVTQVARLDIGFARRTSEIAVLEMHAGYPRAHLTQYLALYSSLSTNYAIEFPENDSVALPLGDMSRNRDRPTGDLRKLQTKYGLAEGVVLEPLTVYSNSTEMVHAEQMIPLEGEMRWGRTEADGKGRPAIKNETGLSLKAALVLRRRSSDQLELAWIGNLEPSQAAQLDFQPATSDSLWRNWRKDVITQPDEPTEQVGAGSDNDALWIGGILEAIVRKTPMLPGQTRLFGYTNDRPSALRIKPAEDQYDGRCVIVAHLSPMELGPVTPDRNILSRTSMPTTQSDQLEELAPQAELP